MSQWSDCLVKAPSSLADTLVAFGQGRKGMGMTSGKHRANAGSCSDRGCPASLTYCPLWGTKDQQRPQRTLMMLISTLKGKRLRELRELEMAREPFAVLKIQMTQL